MNWHGLVKSLELPAGFEPPRLLAYRNIRAHAITRHDLDDDVRGINASLELIRRTRGGGWPTEPVTADGNFVDLVWHELEFREGYSFTYCLRDVDGSYLGCCYLYPVGRRTPLSDDLVDRDVDVSWWVTPAAFDAGHYATAYRALLEWTRTDFPFSRPWFSNIEIPSLDPP
jgi:hypothetical protein